VPKTVIYWEVRRVKIKLTQGGKKNDTAAIGIGSLIIFIAMILVAGVAASVLIQTMNIFEQQALKTGRESIRDISSGLKVTQVSGYYNGSTITQLAIFIEAIAGSDDIDLDNTFISISDSSNKILLNYSNSVFSSTVSGGLFGTLNDSMLTQTTFGIMVVRDIDGSCSSTNPIIDNEDLVILLVNTSQCFNGLDTRIKVSGNIVPEYGISGIISFTTPTVFINTIIELQT
jgi:archaeal flagellin FlaB